MKIHAVFHIIICFWINYGYVGGLEGVYTEIVVMKCTVVYICSIQVPERDAPVASQFFLVVSQVGELRINHTYIFGMILGVYIRTGYVIRISINFYGPSGYIIGWCDPYIPEFCRGCDSYVSSGIKFKGRAVLPQEMKSGVAVYMQAMVKITWIPLLFKNIFLPDLL